MPLRYMVFGFDVYMPSGGMNDLITTVRSMYDAQLFVNKHRESDARKDIYQVLDLLTQTFEYL